MTLQPMPASKALDAYFLEARSKLLDLAAILDRIGRGPGADAVAADERWKRIAEALQALQSAEPDRAAAVQQIFSLNYDPDWPRPTPR
jgi:hypothetical protein